MYTPYLVTSLQSCRSLCMHDTVTMLQRQRHKEFIPPEMWPPNSPDLNPVDYRIGVSFKIGSTVRKSMMCRSWKNVCWGSGGCWTTSSSSWHRLCNSVVDWMHVFAWMVDILNINFKFLTFCHVLFVSSILVSVNVMDVNMCKVLILCKMCYFCVWHFHTVWHQHNKRGAGNSYANDWHSLVKLYTKKIMKIRQYL